MAARRWRRAGGFVYGGTALAEGRGEVVTPLPSLPRMWVVVVVPDVPRRGGARRAPAAGEDEADVRPP